jgi:hypothetical protein
MGYFIYIEAASISRAAGVSIALRASPDECVRGYVFTGNYPIPGCGAIM